MFSAKHSVDVSYAVESLCRFVLSSWLIVEHLKRLEERTSRQAKAHTGCHISIPYPIRPWPTLPSSPLPWAPAKTQRVDSDSILGIMLARRSSPLCAGTDHDVWSAHGDGASYSSSWKLEKTCSRGAARIPLICIRKRRHCHHGVAAHWRCHLTRRCLLL